MGKFMIEPGCTLAEIADKKNNYCIKMEGGSFKKARILGTESDQVRKEWIRALQTVITECSHGKVWSGSDC